MPSQEEINALYKQLGETPPLNTIEPMPKVIDTVQPTSQEVPSKIDILGGAIKEYLPSAAEMAIPMAAAGHLISKVPTAPTVAGGVALLGLSEVLGATTGEAIREATGEADSANFMEFMGNVAENSLWGVLPEGLTVIAQRGWGTVRKLQAGKPITAEEAENLKQLQEALQNSKVKDAAGNLVTLTPAQITKGASEQALEKIAIAGIGGQGMMESMYKAQSEALVKIFNDTVSMIAPRTADSSREFGLAFEQSIDQAKAETRKFFAGRYKTLDEMSTTSSVDMKGIKKELSSLLISNAYRGEGVNDAVIKRIKNTAKKGKDYTSSVIDLDVRLPKEVKESISNILKEGNNITFKEAFTSLKTLDGTIDTLKKQGTAGSVTKQLEDLRTSLHSTLEQGAKNQGIEVYKEYKKINSLYKKAMKNIDSSVVQELVKKSPERVGEFIYATGNVTEVKQAFDALKDAERIARANGTRTDLKGLRQELKSGYVDALLKTVQGEMTSNIDTKTSTIFNKITSDDKTRRTFNAMLNEQERAQVMKVLKWSEDLQDEAAGNFSLIVRGKQSSGFSDIVKGIGGIGAGVGLTVATPLSIASGIALLATPSYLAKRAIRGGKVDKLLSQSKELVMKYDKGEFTNKDAKAMFALLAGTGSERAVSVLSDDEVPEEFTAPGYTPEQVLLYKALGEEVPSTE